MGQEAQARRATYAWPNHSGDLAPPKARRLRTLEAENARLMTLLAVHRDNEGRQEIRQKMADAQARCEQSVCSLANVARPSEPEQGAKAAG